MKKLLAILLPLFLLTGFQAAAEEEELLEPSKAFALSVEVIDAQTVQATWNIAEGYYLYRGKLLFESATDGITLGEPELPAGKIKNDEFFGEVETYRGSVTATIPLQRDAGAGNTLILKTTSQGCADIGVCYPPQRQNHELDLPAADAMAALSEMSGDFGFGAEDEVLDPEQAFRFDSEVIDGNTLLARWTIAPAHYLYKDKLTFELLDNDGVSLGQITLPQGEEKDDEFFGRIEVYHDLVEAQIALQRENLQPTTATLKVGYQGCAEVGICYPPQKKSVALELPAGQPGNGAEVTQTSTPAAATDAPLSEQDQLAAALAGGDTAWTILLFFIAGLLLAFTPCVFPMIPILSSIIVGQGDSMTTRRAFTLSVVYVLAMALTYTVAGVIAGLFGANLQAAFQNPWILGSFAAVFVALSFSMFGFYELQLPSALQGKLTEVSNKQQGGTLTGVAIMGLLSALIVGPCVAPPLMGALIYIGQTGDPYLGGAALFALSMGMGAPLVAIGTAGGKYLPRAGGWMDAVKAVFGVLLLAVAIWMLERILPASIILLLWALLLIISAVYMGAIDAIRDGASGWRKLWKGIGLVLLLQGGLMLVGLAAGNTDPLQPLKGIGFGGAATQQQHLSFKTIKTVEDLEREVATASTQGKTVMLDFYADWCISCKEFEKYTFSDPQVIAALDNTVVLQADVTANDEADQALLKKFKLIGPPGIIFYNSQGKELVSYRMVGFVPADEFTAHINRAFGN
ncbi:MAG: protein-disulfide reductase DsbD [Gammaproteobacteria bacterium]|nr:protein-disulfide reductase DsbD [Gammaproteobacteria bacterium]